MFKRLAKSPTVLRILAALISFYIRMVGATSRWSFDGVDRFEDAAAEEKGVKVSVFVELRRRGAGPGVLEGLLDGRGDFRAWKSLLRKAVHGSFSMREHGATRCSTA